MQQIIYKIPHLRVDKSTKIKIRIQEQIALQS